MIILKNIYEINAIFSKNIEKLQKKNWHILIITSPVTNVANCGEMILFLFQQLLLKIFVFLCDKLFSHLLIAIYVL